MVVQFEKRIVENTITKPDRYAVTYFFYGWRYIEHFSTLYSVQRFLNALPYNVKDVIVWDGLTIVWRAE